MQTACAATFEINSKSILNLDINNPLYTANPNPRTRGMHGNNILQT